MKLLRFTAGGATILAAGILSGCAEQSRPRVSMDPRAENALRKMSDALGKARSFSFQSAAAMDEFIATGQLAQFSRESRIVVRRPDRTFVESRRRDDVWFLWYRGCELTLLDTAAKTYACVKVPPRIEAMLDDVAQKHGLTLPLADLLFPDPYKVMTADAQTGRYLGLHDVSGVKCHHLLFTQAAVDWQIWIDAGAQPVPRKLVIDYKNLPGRPQFTAVLSDWNLSARAKDEQFKAVLPKEARKVEMARLLEAEKKGK
jgi:hypothetical protein